MSLASQRAVLLRGDPGLFDILKRGASFLARKVAPTLIPPPIRLGLDLARGARGIRQIALPAPPPGLRFPQGPGTLSIAGGGGLGGAELMAGGCPKGFHANRSSYHTLTGFVERGTRCVRNRRRNLSNGRANTRALRRIVATEKQDKKRRTVLKAIARSAS